MPPGDVLLEDVVLQCAVQHVGLNPLRPGGGDVQGKQHRGGGVDGHGGADPVQGNPIEKGLHVHQAADGDANLSYLALGQRVVRVVADLRRQVEGDREAGLPLVQKVSVSPVRLAGTGVAGILAHGPHPALVHVGLHATSVGVLTGIPDICVVAGFGLREVIRRIHRIQLQPGVRAELCLAGGKALQRRFQGLPAPLFLVLRGHSSLL